MRLKLHSVALTVDGTNVVGWDSILGVIWAQMVLEGNFLAGFVPPHDQTPFSGSKRFDPMVAPGTNGFPWEITGGVLVSLFF